MPPVLCHALAALALCLLVLGAVPRPVAAEDVLVFAAASLKNALEDVRDAWQRESGGTAALSFAGSSTLARQIQQGAPADVFVSANIAWMDLLERDGLIRADTRVALLRNRLVLVAHGRDAPLVTIAPGVDLAGLLGDGRLAMALVEAVPAGIYGKAALTALGIWPAVAPRIAQTDNVRAALALVARGEAPFGIVYATDAIAGQGLAGGGLAGGGLAGGGLAGDGITVVGEFPADSHPPIVYPAAVTAESEHPRARAFLDFLSSATARPLFERQGFMLVE